MTCTSACRKPNGNQAHCGACHQTFSAVTTFDRHRRGPVDGRICIAPATAGLRLNPHGVWTGEGRPAFWTGVPQSSGDPETAESTVSVPAPTLGRSEAVETISGGGSR